MAFNTKYAFDVARSFSGRAWSFVPCDEEAVRDLTLHHDVSAMLARLLLARGVGAEDIEDYLNPTLRRLLPEPRLLADMDAALARVAGAVMGGQSIAVYGDYDVDGSCSAALLAEYLRAVGTVPRLYVPDRLTEGYGPNAAALLQLKADGVSLVVTVDCGAGAVGPLKAAADAGLDVVVLDHHACEVPPPAVAHVNPNRPGDESGLGVLCAAGVVFLFCVALSRHLRQSGWFESRPEPDLRSGLDLVALATVCDVVPLTGVNRLFVRTGLPRLDGLGRPGLAALAEVAGAKPPFSAYHLGFVFGPRINAGGRVGRSSLGYDLLTAIDPAAAQDFAQALDTHNRERQALETLILDEAVAQADTQSDSPFLLVTGEGWHPGVVGIVAGRLKERFGKPALVAGFEGGLGRGSARSVAGVNLGAMVRGAREAGILTAGGGHAMAAGFSLTPEAVEPFRAFLSERFAGTDLGGPEDVCLEAVVSPAGANETLVAEIEKLGPFGAGCAEPLVGVPSVRVAFADTVGKDHVRLNLVGAEGARLAAIAFRAGDTDLGRGLLAARGKFIHVVGRLRRNEWNGRTTIQMQIEDAAAAG